VIANDLGWARSLVVWVFVVADDPRVGAEPGRLGVCDRRRTRDREPKGKGDWRRSTVAMCCKNRWPYLNNVVPYERSFTASG